MPTDDSTMTNTHCLTLDRNPAITGSPCYYSLQSLQTAPRNALIGLQAFANEIHKISEHYQEPSVAKIKLQWWQEELDRLATEPRHPITQWLQPAMEQYALDPQHLHAIVEAGHASLTQQQFSNAAELYRHYQYTGGILETLKAQVLCASSLDNNTTQATHYLGIANEIVRHITDAPVHFQRQQYYFVATDHLPSVRQDAAQRNTLWQQQTIQANKCYQDAVTLLQPKTLQALRPLRFYTHLQLRLLHKMQRQQFPTLQHQVTLSPLNMLWRSYWFA